MPNPFQIPDAPKLTDTGFMIQRKFGPKSIGIKATIKIPRQVIPQVAQKVNPIKLRSL